MAIFGQGRATNFRKPKIPSDMGDFLSLPRADFKLNRFSNSVVSYMISTLFQTKVIQLRGNKNDNELKVPLLLFSDYLRHIRKPIAQEQLTKENPKSLGNYS